MCRRGRSAVPGVDGADLERLGMSALGSDPARVDPAWIDPWDLAMLRPGSHVPSAAWGRSSLGIPAPRVSAQERGRPAQPGQRGTGQVGNEGRPGCAGPAGKQADRDIDPAGKQGDRDAGPAGKQVCRPSRVSCLFRPGLQCAGPASL
jgi:hypothetical protein